MLRVYGTALTTFLVWDWITTAGTRLIVDRSLWSLPIAAITTVLWIYGVKLSLEEWKVIPFIVVGVVVGTWFGITWP